MIDYRFSEAWYVIRRDIPLRESLKEWISELPADRRSDLLNRRWTPLAGCQPIDLSKTADEQGMSNCDSIYGYHHPPREKEFDFDDSDDSEPSQKKE